MNSPIGLHNWSYMIKADMLKVVREPFFLFILLTPFFLGYGLHYLLPYLTDQYQDFDLAFYFPIIIALLILTPPLYYGFVLGLQVLDEKDEGVLLAVAVTPISLKTYLAARLSVYSLVNIPLIYSVHEMIGVIVIDRVQLFWVAVACSLNTPLFVLLLAAFAKNQLEGFVIGKGLGFLILFPLAMFFVPDYWHLICGILPTYWPIIAYYTASAASGSALFFYFAIALSLIMQPIAIVYLYRKFEGSLLRV